MNYRIRNIVYKSVFLIQNPHFSRYNSLDLLRRGWVEGITRPLACYHGLALVSAHSRVGPVAGLHLYSLLVEAGLGLVPETTIRFLTGSYVRLCTGHLFESRPTFCFRPQLWLHWEKSHGKNLGPTSGFALSWEKSRTNFGLRPQLFLDFYSYPLSVRKLHWRSLLIFHFYTSII